MVLASSAALELEEGRGSCVSMLIKAEGSLQHETLILPTQQETTCVFLSSAGRLFAAGDMCCRALSLIRPAACTETRSLRSGHLMAHQSLAVPRACQ